MTCKESLRVHPLLLVGGMMFLLAISLMFIAGSASAHGYIESPGSRAYLCSLGENTNCGLIIYEPQSTEAAGNYPASGPADGHIASADNKFPELDAQTATRWTKVNMTSGSNTFSWHFTAAHSTKEWKYYITKQDWDPNSPLTRADFETNPFCRIDGHSTQPPFDVSHTCNVPSRTGYQVILGVWEIADTGNAFYHVIDADFGDSGTHDTQPPTAPSNLDVTATTSFTVSLSWDASSDNIGVSGYRIFSGTSQIAEVSGSILSYTATGLTPNTPYTFTVKALDSAGNVSDASNAVNTVTASGSTDTEAPSAPGNLHVMDTTSSSVSLMWSPATDNVGVTGYRIYRGSTLVASLSGTTFDYIVTGLTADTAYTFTAKALDAAGNLSDASNAVNATTDPESTDPCSQYAPWDASTAYNGGQRVSYNGKIYEAKWWSQGQQPDQSGQWGDWKYISDCDGGGTPADTQAPTAPQNLHVMSTSSSSVSLMWGAATDNVGVTGYQIYRGSTLVTTVSGSTLNYTVDGLTADTAYTFTAKALDAAGNLSDASNAANATTDAGSGTPTTPAWAPGVAYQIGDLVSYNNATYRCVQPHTSQIGWEPSNVPALWSAQ